MKFIKSIILILFISACGYKPILVNKETDFNYKNLNLKGNLKISKKVSDNLQNLKNESSNNTLIIDTIYSKQVESKNKKGNPEVFSMKILTKLTVLQNGKASNSTFNESLSYNNKENKFELKQFENNLTNNLIDKISADIITYLQSYK